MRHPLGGCTWRSLLQHTIDLLEGEAFCFRNKEVGECEGDDAQRTPHEVDLRAKVRVAFSGPDEIWGDDTNDLGFVSQNGKELCVRRELTQFHIQLEAVERPTPRERMGSGKISPMETHATGPHVKEKIATLIIINAIIEETAGLLCAESFPAVTPTIPTMNCDEIMPTEPQMRSVRRPHLSTA
jgi:hypothetical protein